LLDGGGGRLTGARELFGGGGRLTGTEVVGGGGGGTVGGGGGGVEAGHELSSGCHSGQVGANNGPVKSPSRQVLVEAHHPQYGSLAQAIHPVWMSHGRVVQVSKNHSVQFPAMPPGPSVVPARHSLVESHHPQS
jgi:hypothetical protein